MSEWKVDNEKPAWISYDFGQTTAQKNATAFAVEDLKRLNKAYFKFLKEQNEESFTVEIII